LAPFPQHQLPRLFAADELIGGSFTGSRSQLQVLREQIVGKDNNWQLHSNEVLVDYGRLNKSPRLGDTMACSFVAFRILVCDPKEPDVVVVVVTQLFVDHPWAMIYSREIFGFPAIFAKFEEREQGVKVLVEGTGADDLRTAVELSWQSPPEGSSPPPPESFWHKLKASLEGGRMPRLPFLQHKQMRDGLDASRACYQALVHGGMTIAAVDPDVRNRHLTLTLDNPDVLAPADLGLTTPVTSKDGYRASGLTLGVQVESAPQHPVVRSARNGKLLRQRRGDPQAAPAYLFNDVEIVGFRLPVRSDLLQAVCDTWLNDPFPKRTYKYVPAKVDLVVECLDYPSIRSENPPPGMSAQTATRQRELVFRILVGRVDEDGRMLRAPAVFCPFVFVDSVTSLISGREVIGYPKVLASFTSLGERGQFDACKVMATPPGPASPGPLSLVTFDCRFDRNPPDVEDLFLVQDESRQRIQEPDPFIEKTRVRASSLPLDINFAWWGVSDLQSGGTDGEAFMESWLEGQSYGYAGLQVKRFPDARRMQQDCYNEIVECEYTLLQAAVSLPQHDASLYFPTDEGNDVYGIARAFGFPPVVPVPPGSWYRTKVDFAFRVTDPLA
jgi:hypothetical protein